MNRKIALVICKMIEAAKCWLLLESNSSCTKYTHSFENPVEITLHF